MPTAKEFTLASLSNCTPRKLLSLLTKSSWLMRLTAA